MSLTPLSLVSNWTKCSCHKVSPFLLSLGPNQVFLWRGRKETESMHWDVISSTCTLSILGRGPFKTPAQTGLQLNYLQSGTHCNFKSVTKSPVQKNSQGPDLTLSQPEFRPGPELHHISIASPTPAPPSWLLRDQLFNGPNGSNLKNGISRIIILIII